MLAGRGAGGGASSLVVGACTALAYAVVAVAANFVTKLAGLLLPGAPDAVLATQLALMSAVVQAGRRTGLVDWAPTTLSRMLAFLPLSLAYGAHAALVLRALAILNVPIYNTLKRLTPIMVLSAKACIERRLPSLGVTLSVVLVVAGCVVAGLGDLTFELRSYTLGLTAAALQAAYILLAEYAGPSNGSATPRIISLSQLSPRALDKDRGSLGGAAGPGGPTGVPGLPSLLPEPPPLTLGGYMRASRSDPGTAPLLGYDAQRAGAAAVPGCVASLPPGLRTALSVAAEGMHYAALTCLPLAAMAALVSGQLQALDKGLAKTVDDLGAVAAGAWVLVIASIEWLLTGSLILCTQTNSALTTTVVGVLKGILAVVLGFFLLGGVGPQGMSGLGITGITMNCAGGVWYAYVKLQESSAAKKPARS